MRSISVHFFYLIIVSCTWHNEAVVHASSEAAGRFVICWGCQSAD